MMTGAMFMAECLRQEGVTKVFGQCGHTNYALIDACHKLGIEYVSFRHEQMAAHAADAYFRVTHKLAVLNVHISPGMTNALTGVVTAAADCTPMVVIAGNTPSYHHAREPHQGIRFHADASQGDIYRPICKRVWRVDDAKFLHDVMPRALNVAQTGRPGAVFLDIPMDVFSAHVEPPVHATTRRRAADGRTGAAPASVTAAAELLAGARSPAIFAGNGAVLSEAAEELRILAESLGAPVATTLMAKGIIPDEHPLACGMSGIWGTRVANDVMRGADVLACRGHGVRRSRLQLVAARIHLRDSAHAARADRHRPAGDRQAVSGRNRSRRRRQDRPSPVERAPAGHADRAAGRASAAPPTCSACDRAGPRSSPRASTTTACPSIPPGCWGRLPRWRRRTRSM